MTLQEIKDFVRDADYGYKGDLSLKVRYFEGCVEIGTCIKSFNINISSELTPILDITTESIRKHIQDIVDIYIHIVRNHEPLKKEIKN